MKNLWIVGGKNRRGKIYRLIAIHPATSASATAPPVRTKRRSSSDIQIIPRGARSYVGPADSNSWGFYLCGYEVTKVELAYA